MDIILVLACAYMAYSCVTSALSVPFAQWQAVQYALIVVAVLLVLVGGHRAWTLYKKSRQTPVEAEEVPPDDAEDDEKGTDTEVGTEADEEGKENEE